MFRKVAQCLGDASSVGRVRVQAHLTFPIVGNKGIEGGKGNSKELAAWCHGLRWFIGRGELSSMSAESVKAL